MKNWLTIGSFSKQAGITPRTLRVYEELGLIKAHSRGENGYRYYLTDQLELITRIKKFKGLGFSLTEIQSLLEVDSELNSEKLECLLKAKLDSIQQQGLQIQSQKNQIENILSSLKQNQQGPGLNINQRRFIMNQLEKFSVIITGTHHLEKTAELIQMLIRKNGKNIPVQVWDGHSPLPEKKPFICVIPEKHLNHEMVQHLTPDIVVIKEVSGNSSETQSAYLKLFNSSGPHMNTILNADDRAVIDLAAHEMIRKGKTYYFSKNSGLRPQIQKIGGVFSDGETIQIYKFNEIHPLLEIKMSQIMGLSDETAWMASLAAVMDIGMDLDLFCRSLELQ